MKLKLKRGTTSKLLRIFVQDSAQTVVAGKTGLAWNTGSLIWYYAIEGAASAVSVSLQTMTMGTWASGGFKVVDGTNMPGVYEIGIPDLALASGNSVVMVLQGASGMSPVVIEIELDAVNYQSATAFSTSCPIDLTTAVPTSNTAQTVGDCLNAARADGFGKWVLSGTTLNLYAADGITVVHSFTLDSGTVPTQRA